MTILQLNDFKIYIYVTLPLVNEAHVGVECRFHFKPQRLPPLGLQETKTSVRPTEKQSRDKTESKEQEGEKKLDGRDKAWDMRQKYDNLRKKKRKDD